MSTTTDPPPPATPLGTVLVVGGNGFVGKHVVDQLLNFPSETADFPSSTSTLSTSLGANTGRYAYQLPSLRGRYPSYSPSTTRVHALDLKCTHNRLPGCTYHEADITSPAQLVEVFRKVQPDVVINTASPSWEAPHAILQKVNIEGTRTLLEVAAGHKHSWGGHAKVFVHTSSSSVIHDAHSDLMNADERWPYIVPNPREYYSETKAIAEKIVLDANDSDARATKGMYTCAIRPAGIIGEEDRGGITWGWLSTARESKDWKLHMQIGEGDNLFDLTYVGNVAYGLLLAAQGLLATSERGGGVLEHERVDGEAFIVTNDCPTYFWDTTRYVWTRYGKEIDVKKVRSLPEWLMGVVGGLSELAGWIGGKRGKVTRQSVKYSCINRYYSCEKLKRRCGYRPVVDVEEGLARSVRWFVEMQGEGEKKVQ